METPEARWERLRALAKQRVQEARVPGNCTNPWAAGEGLDNPGNRPRQGLRLMPPRFKTISQQDVVQTHSLGLMALFV